MQAEAELTSLHKKLQSPWSSWTVTSSVSKQLLLEEIIKNHNLFDKKVKIRILISLLTIEYEKRVESLQTIVKLLDLASSDTSDTWISITAGLVHKKLFPYRANEPIEINVNQKVTDTVEAIIRKLEESTYGNSINDMQIESVPDEKGHNSDDNDAYYLPYEYKYFSNSLISSKLLNNADAIASLHLNTPPVLPSSDDSSVPIRHTHFTYTGKMPDFLKRDRENMSVIIKPRILANANTLATSSSASQSLTQPATLSKAHTTLTNTNTTINPPNNRLNLGAKMTASSSVPAKPFPLTSASSSSSSIFRSGTSSSAHPKKNYLSSTTALGKLPRESAGVTQTISVDAIRKLSQKTTTIATETSSVLPAKASIVKDKNPAKKVKSEVDIGANSSTAAATTGESEVFNNSQSTYATVTSAAESRLLQSTQESYNTYTSSDNGGVK